jgi:polyphosphate kinase
MSQTNQADKKFGKPVSDTRFLNRELSQIAFNRRVLAQAEDPSIPLLERLRYLCIVSSNLDEFFEVRIASLMARNRHQTGSNQNGSDIIEKPWK